MVKKTSERDDTSHYATPGTRLGSASVSRAPFVTPELCIGSCRRVCTLASPRSYIPTWTTMNPPYCAPPLITTRLSAQAAVTVCSRLAKWTIIYFVYISYRMTFIKLYDKILIIKIINYNYVEIFIKIDIKIYVQILHTNTLISFL